MAKGSRPSELARQRASVRDSNERIGTETTDATRDHVSIQCECGDDACTTVIDLNTDAYQAIRQHPDWFVVADSHDVPEIGRIEQRRGAFMIVKSTYIGQPTPSIG